MIKLRRKMLGLAAITKVYAHNIKAGAECFVGRRQHVARRRRTLHAVPHDQGRMIRAIHLPTRARPYLGVRCDGEQTLFISALIARAKAAGPLKYKN